MTNYFLENELSGNELFDALRMACEGLEFVTEIDAPVQPFTGPYTTTVTPETVARAADIREDCGVEIAEFATLFDRLTAKKDWHTAAHNERKEKYLELRELLEGNLRELKVFRFGKVRIAVIVAGVDRDNRLMGVRTEAVET